MELAELELELLVLTTLIWGLSRAAKVAVAVEAAEAALVSPVMADLAAAVVVVAPPAPVPELAGLVVAAVDERGLAAKVAVAVAQMAALAALAL